VRHRLAPRADLVDDVVQDVFLAALGGLSTFRGTSPLRSWLLGIARHKVESFYRQQLREPEPLADGGDAFNQLLAAR
jgi:DNA-directed RNA polymerase specialized sigma24 family protein